MLQKAFSKVDVLDKIPSKTNYLYTIRILRFVEGYAKKSEFVEHQIQTGSKC